MLARIHKTKIWGFSKLYFNNSIISRKFDSWRFLGWEIEIWLKLQCTLKGAPPAPLHLIHLQLHNFVVLSLLNLKLKILINWHLFSINMQFFENLCKKYLTISSFIFKKLKKQEVPNLYLFLSIVEQKKWEIIL